MRKYLRLLLLLSMFAGTAWASNTHGTPDEAKERAAWFADLMAPFVRSGCLPAVPAGSLTLGAFSCTGYVRGASGEWVYVNQAATAVGGLNQGDGTYWLGLHRDVSSVVSGWTRQVGTHYAWHKATDKPTIAQGQVVSKITVAGAIITAVEDLRVPASYVRHGTYDVTDSLYGALADDSTDAGPAIRAAIAAAIAQNGGIVRIPQGLYALGSGVVVPAGVEVRGDGWSPSQTPTAALTPEPRRGTWLHVSSTAFSPFTLTGNGAVVKDIAFDHDQPAPTVGWAPIQYPYVVTIEAPAPWMNGDIRLENLFFLKASHGINQGSVGAQSSGRLTLRGIWGQVFNVGIRLEFLADVSHVSNVHLWPYWSADTNVMTYQHLNMIGLALLRTDALMLRDIFVLGANVGLYFFDNAYGPTAGLQAANLSFDVVRIGVYANQTGTSGQMTNLRTFGSWDGIAITPNFETSTGIVIEKGFVALDVSNFEAGSLGQSCARVLFGQSVLTLSNVRCNNFNLGGAGLPALQATAGNILVGGTQYITTAHGAPSYGGAFLSSVFPNGAVFNQEGTFLATTVGGNPLIGFGINDFLQWIPAANRFQFNAAAGTYNTGGVTKYLCVTNGELTVGTTCP